MDTYIEEQSEITGRTYEASRQQQTKQTLRNEIYQPCLPKCDYMRKNWSLITEKA